MFTNETIFNENLEIVKITFSSYYKLRLIKLGINFKTLH